MVPKFPTKYILYIVSKSKRWLGEQTLGNSKSIKSRIANLHLHLKSLFLHTTSNRIDSKFNIGIAVFLRKMYSEDKPAHLRNSNIRSYKHEKSDMWSCFAFPIKMLCSLKLCYNYNWGHWPILQPAGFLIFCCLLFLMAKGLIFFAFSYGGRVKFFAFSYSSRRVNLSKSQVVFQPFGSYTTFCLKKKEAKSILSLKLKS